MLRKVPDEGTLSPPATWKVMDVLPQLKAATDKQNAPCSVDLVYASDVSGIFIVNPKYLIARYGRGYALHITMLPVIADAMDSQEVFCPVR